MKNFDAVVIGAGPGGYPTAIRLAQLGKKTAIVEKENFGGVCLNVGCIPSKALIYGSSQFWKMKHEAEELGITTRSVECDLGKMQDWKSGVVKKLTTGVQGLLKANGVEIIKGTATFKDSKTLEVVSAGGKEALTATHFVIATGSRVAQIPSLPFNGKNILSSTEALSLKQLPKEMVVIGGGFIGIEIGTVYAKLGSKVTIVEALDQLLATVDSELVAVVQKKMKHYGITVHTGAKALGIKEKDALKASKLNLEIETKEKTKQTLSADVILVSVGRKPNSDNMGLEKVGIKMDPRGNILTNNQSLTNLPHIFAIGDVAGAPQLAHRATMDGLLVADCIAGKKAFKDYKTVPWAVFCDPEIAVAGLTEKEATEKGFKVKVGRFPFAASGKALAMNESEGMAKIVVDENTQAILGVHVVGPEASNLIAEAALAIEMGATVEDLVRTIHTHPTLPEVMPEAVEAAFYKAIHIYKPKRG